MAEFQVSEPALFCEAGMCHALEVIVMEEDIQRWKEEDNWDGIPYVGAGPIEVISLP